MTLPDEKLLKECAKWIYDNKHTGFWTPYTITALNVAAPNNPHVTTDQAFWVFIELAKRRLMVHKIFDGGNGLFPAFGFNYDKEKEWNKLANKSGFFRLRFIPWMLWLLKQSWLVIVFIIAIIANNVLSEFAKHYTKAYLDKPAKLQTISPALNIPPARL